MSGAKGYGYIVILVMTLAKGWGYIVTLAMTCSDGVHTHNRFCLVPVIASLDLLKDVNYKYKTYSPKLL